ncbi:MAG: RNA 3'-terminal phosphate cyclase [Thermoguttaceae bacterium]|nr:RNA 3'-terminal phosphate cyclase [Thermoguttaceae bacterium]
MAEVDLVLDGAMGEGGGQILRSALSLSAVTGRAFRIERIRAARKKPGLQAQHLTAVLAAAQICQAQVEGASLGSQQLAFWPGPVRGGRYEFDVGTAGSTTLVLQTVLPALALAKEPSELILQGGTHNPLAPPFDFLVEVFLPMLRQMDVRVEAELEAYGFYPAGGGRVRVRIHPTAQLRPIEMLHRGRILEHRIYAVVSRLPRHIGEREVETARKWLGWEKKSTHILEVNSVGPGNYVAIRIQCEHATELFTAFGQIKVPAEKVGMEAARQAQQWLEADVPVGPHLADQMLIYLALAGGGAFRTQSPTLHTKTNLEVVTRFLERKLRLEPQTDKQWLVSVETE